MKKIGILLLAAAVVIAVLMICSIHGFKPNNQKQKEIIESVSVSEPEDYTKQPENQQDLSTDADEEFEEDGLRIQKDLVIQGLDESLKAQIDEKQCLEQLQVQLYAYGFYDLQDVVFEEGEQTGDTVTLSVTIHANKTIDADMIYTRKDDSWYLKIW